MTGPHISDRSPSISLLLIFAVIIVLGWFIIGQVLALIVAAGVYEGRLLEAFMDPLNHPDLKNTLLLSQFVAASTAFILVPFFYITVIEKKKLSIFFKSEKQWPVLILVIALAVVSLAVAISPVAEWNAGVQFPEWLSGFGEWAKKTEATAEAVVKTMTNNMDPVTFMFVLVVVAILPGIGEELVFRGFIQTEFTRAFRNPHVAILVTSIIFSAFHLQFLGFFPRMLIGMFLGYLYYWSGNLLIPVIGHMINNGIQVIGLYLYQQGAISLDVESTESAPVMYVVIAVLLTILFLWYLRNYFQGQPAEQRDVTPGI